MERLAPLRLAALLAAAGLPEEEIGGKLALFSTASEAFAGLAPGPPAGAWWVPGRIEVFGKHTDYAGGQSLLAAVPRGFFVLGKPRGDGKLRVVDAGTGVTVDLAPVLPGGDEAGEIAGIDQNRAPSFARYVRTLTLRLTRNFPGAPLGADLAFASDLPQAAGLSSSSALTVGIADALVRFAGLEGRPEWRAAIRTLEHRAGYFACLENGADFGPLAGSPGVGALTGSEDPTAILGCRAGHLSRYSFLPGVRHGDVPFPAGWRFVIATSGVVAAKAGNARERYNRAASGVAALLAIWNRDEVAEGRAPAPSLAAGLAGDPEAEPILRERIEGSVFAASEPARDDSRPSGGPASVLKGLDLQTRLTHFLHENPRAARAAEAVQRGDEEALGHLAAASQRDAEELLGNQIPETITLAALARDAGAFAASAFGGGFGGAVWALVRAGEPAEAEDFARRWLAAYRRRFPRHAGAESFTASPGPGLLDLLP